MTHDFPLLLEWHRKPFVIDLPKRKKVILVKQRYLKINIV